MNSAPLVVATRSRHKLDEILQILPSIPGLRILDLNAAGISPAPGEDEIEAFETFEENATAKARYFCARTGLPVLADDSGLCVDALGGAPGVHSKRFAGADRLVGAALDQANNERLLLDLADVPEPARTARYVCVLAVVTPDGDESLAHGSIDGRILTAPRGSGGFGYDPLFYVPQLGATFAQVPQALKNRSSHRGRALRAAIPILRRIASDPLGSYENRPSAG